MHLLLQLIHLELINELSGHEIPLVLLLLLVLQMAPNHVEHSVVQDKAVAETAFVANDSDEDVLAFGVFLAVDSADVLEHGAFDEADQEHLVHVHAARGLINV